MLFAHLAFIIMTAMTPHCHAGDTSNCHYGDSVNVTTPAASVFAEVHPVHGTLVYTVTVYP